MWSLLAIACLVALAYSNGANDNMKPVATLVASRTLSYRSALWLTTVSTFLGCLTALFIGKDLIRSFSGKGLVHDRVLLDPAFLTAVGLGAAGTVFLATRIGMPISTTHALLGALLGAGLTTPEGVVPSVLMTKFLLPLLLSPVAAAILAGLLYVAVPRARRIFAREADLCVCVSEPVPSAPVLATSALSSASPSEAVLTLGNPTLPRLPSPLAVTLDTRERCEERNLTTVLGLEARRLVDAVHFLSAGAVGFARGLNDTPKIVALAAGVFAISTPKAVPPVAVIMALGGILSARRVATTMSEKISHMDHGQGLTANLVTSFLTIFASRWGLPVSTTHVSVGSIVGIGTVNGSARWRMITRILASWVTTLPLAALLSATVFLLLRE